MDSHTVKIKAVAVISILLLVISFFYFKRKMVLNIERKLTFSFGLSNEINTLQMTSISFYLISIIIICNLIDTQKKRLFTNK